MKAASVTLLVISLVLTVVTTSSVASRGINQGEAVLDYKGNPVQPEKPYYIRVADQPGKWVSRDSRFPTEQCPKVAVLSSYRIPVVFLQESPAQQVSVNSNISIRFDWPDPCLETKVWRVDKDTPFPKPDIPTNGWVFTPVSTFKIQQVENGYKFVFESNNNVGVYPASPTAIYHLVLTETPLVVEFFPGWWDQENNTSSFLDTMVPFI